jgi:hypothetical protein
MVLERRTGAVLTDERALQRALQTLAPPSIARGDWQDVLRRAAGVSSVQWRRRRVRGCNEATPSGDGQGWGTRSPRRPQGRETLGWGTRAL